MGFHNNKTGRYQHYSDSERREYGRRRREEERKAIMAEWITVWRLKEERNWTDGAIRRFLGEPVSQNGYKVFARVDVLKAEKGKDFKAWMSTRIEKQYRANLSKNGQDYAETAKKHIESVLWPAVSAPPKTHEESPAPFEIEEPVIIARCHPLHGYSIRNYQNTLSTVIGVRGDRVSLRLMNGSVVHLNSKYLDRPTAEELKTLRGNFQLRDQSLKLTGAQQLALYDLEKALQRCGDSGLQLSEAEGKLYVTKAYQPRSDHHKQERQLFEVDTGNCHFHTPSASEGPHS
ncbi:hypothetical protein [Marinobacterium jannaschii]|uniref:hypothetical protein n=1 Tax=Marinobacterium jannaschii TaxID=64970 RepID=UPI000685C1EC|nr:hypothetical protein [Marinobacterium jannaschii]